MNRLDPYNALDWLRLLCGGFLIPHAWAKVTSPGPRQFFEAAGFPHPGVFMYGAFGIELLTAVLLILGIWRQEAAALAGVFLLVASVATLKVSKGKWLWMIGGCEYPLFWALCCFILAMQR
jgi:putative oxidoreductase